MCTAMTQGRPLLRVWSAAERPTVSIRTIVGACLSRLDEADSEGTDEGIGSRGNRSRCAIFCRPTICPRPLHRCGPANGRADDAFARSLRPLGRRPLFFQRGTSPPNRGYPLHTLGSPLVSPGFGGCQVPADRRLLAASQPSAARWPSVLCDRRAL
jgi:hypothetical protein